MAATSIATLSVNLTVSSKKFTRRMQKASARIRKFGGSVRRAAFGLKGLAVGLLAAAGLRGMQAMLQTTMAEIDALGKLSDILNITTERLDALRFGAVLAGATQKELDKALQIFTRRLGEARIGAGEAVKGLKLLGLSADDLVDMKLDDAIGKVSDAINKLPNEADQAAAAFTLFGRQGVSIANLLKVGSKAMREFTEETKKYGTAISRIDSAKVEAANDAIERLQKVFKGFNTQLVVKIAPMIELISNKFVSWATNTNKVITLVQKGFDFITSSMPMIVRMFNFAESSVARFKIVIAAVSAVAAHFKAGFAIMVTEFKAFSSFIVAHGGRAILAYMNLWQTIFLLPIRRFFKSEAAQKMFGKVIEVPDLISASKRSSILKDLEFLKTNSKKVAAEERVTNQARVKDADRAAAKVLIAFDEFDNLFKKQANRLPVWTKFWKDTENASMAAIKLAGAHNEELDGRLEKEKEISKQGFKQVKISRLFLRTSEKIAKEAKKRHRLDNVTVLGNIPNIVRFKRPERAASTVLNHPGLGAGGVQSMGGVAAKAKAASSASKAATGPKPAGTNEVVAPRTDSLLEQLVVNTSSQKPAMVG